MNIHTYIYIYIYIYIHTYIHRYNTGRPEHGGGRAPKSARNQDIPCHVRIPARAHATHTVMTLKGSSSAHAKMHARTRAAKLTS